MSAPKGLHRRAEAAGRSPAGLSEAKTGGYGKAVRWSSLAVPRGIADTDNNHGEAVPWRPGEELFAEGEADARSDRQGRPSSGPPNLTEAKSMERKVRGSPTGLEAGGL